MSLSIPQLPALDKLPVPFSLPIIEQLYPRDTICELLTRFGRWEQRERKLSQYVILYVLVVWPLFLLHSLCAVFVHLTSSLRLLDGFSAHIIPSRAAFPFRRKQLGVRLFRALFLACCRPLAPSTTLRAFAFGLRVMAIDGTLEDVYDAPENARFFGRLCSGPTSSSFPQMRCVLLVEAGTHAIVNALLAPCHIDERRLSWGLLSSLHEGMLLLLDRGFVSASYLEAVRARGATDALLANISPPTNPSHLYHNSDQGLP